MGTQKPHAIENPWFGWPEWVGSVCAPMTSDAPVRWLAGNFGMRRYGVCPVRASDSTIRPRYGSLNGSTPHFRRSQQEPARVASWSRVVETCDGSLERPAPKLSRTPLVGSGVENRAELGLGLGSGSAPGQGACAHVRLCPTLSIPAATGGLCIT